MITYVYVTEKQLLLLTLKISLNLQAVFSKRVITKLNCKCIVVRLGVWFDRGTFVEHFLAFKLKIPGLYLIYVV